MEFDWDKISEIVFQGVVQAIVTAIAVISAYLLGRRQSDINWKREIKQRDREHSETMSVNYEQLKLAQTEQELAEIEYRRRMEEARIKDWGDD